MYSKNDPDEVQALMQSLGFSSNEDATIIHLVLKKFTGKIVIIKNGGDELQIIGKLHSATLIFGEHLNLIEVQEKKCSKGVLNELNYYHPRNYKPELGKRNFVFVSAAFNEDPQKTDLLVVPITGCSLECEGETFQF